MKDDMAMEKEMFFSYYYCFEIYQIKNIVNLIFLTMLYELDQKEMVLFASIVI